MKIVIREIEQADLQSIIKLFYDTVHHVNAADYSKKQCAAWAPKTLLTDYKDSRLYQSLLQHQTYVVVRDKLIVGFANITDAGCIDHLYVHKDYQYQGIATALLQKLEACARIMGIKQVTANVSVTAKLFFQHQGYQVVEKQAVLRQGITFVNYKMCK